MANTFGRRILGADAFETVTAQEQGGGSVFGHRVLGRHVPPAVAPIPRGSPGAAPPHLVAQGVAVEDLKEILHTTPVMFDALYEAELARPEGPRMAAMRQLLQVETSAQGQQRPDVIEELHVLLGMDPALTTSSSTSPAADVDGAATAAVPVPTTSRARRGGRRGDGQDSDRTPRRT